MQQETLQATKRVTSGSRPSNRLRREDRVPAVVYGSSPGFVCPPSGAVCHEVFTER